MNQPTIWERQGLPWRTFDLFLVSFLGLFLEILLVRWLGSEIRIFAYFKNFVLVTCFFGLGLGFRLAARRSLFALFPAALATLVVLVRFLEPPLRKSLRHLPSAADLHFWSLDDSQQLSQAVLFYVVVAGGFLLVTFTFIPLGQLTGRLMKTLDPLPSYSWNLLGALFGVAAFSVLSFLDTAPFVWVLVAAAATVFLSRRDMTLVAVTVLFVAPALYVLHDSRLTIYWSPYQKIEVSRLGLPIDRKGPLADAGYLLETNQDYHQKLLPLGEEYLKKHGTQYPELVTAAKAYSLPYDVKPAPGDVLILGAGAGNDVASALRNGAERIQAVEIDPVILELGRELHPERPYASPRVRVAVGDARAFLEQGRQSYDLIVYGLVDSHTLLSSRSGIRLDNFLYTRESFEGARSLLKEDGILFVTFSVPRDKVWLGSRLFGMLKEVFGEEPYCRATDYDRSIAFVVGAERTRLGPRWESCRERMGLLPSVPLATDDWPFLYLKERRVPAIYFTVIALTVGLSAALLFWLAPGARTIRADFFLLGAAFMLVEVKAVTELALVMGTTWLVNSAAVAGILFVALAANVWTERARAIDLRYVYALLFLSLGVGYVFPKQWLLGGNPLVQGALATLLLCAPVLFAGLIFSRQLQRTGSVDTALASNLFGAMVGGFLEYGSLIVGIGNLYLVAASLYALSFRWIGASRD